jgi:oxygen-dependent protoporphyrinogen oxidase
MIRGTQAGTFKEGNDQGMSRIVIVGGGIAGLTAAYTLGKSGRHEVTLLEATNSLGGKIGTDRAGELLIERGPDSIFTVKPAALQLICELGLEDELIEPQGGEFSILVDGKLHQVPRALATMMRTASGVLEKVGFLSAAAKERVLGERDVPKGSGRDESIASFFRRRFGKRFSTLVAEPLLAGIHAGDPEKLSMMALYPAYLGLEQRQGSLTGSSQTTPVASGKPAFQTLRNGMGTLVDSLDSSLENVHVRLDANVDAVRRNGAGLVVEAQEPIEADHVILAVPAWAAARMLSASAPESAAALRRIRFVSTAVVTLAYPRTAFPENLPGNGFLVPYHEPCDITGCTWTSQKWQGRSPEDVALLRVFMGQDGGFNVEEHSDEDLVARAKTSLSRLMRTTLPPTFERLDRWTKAMPQYDVGHLDLLAEAERGLKGMPITFAGSSYRGNGIPDCVRQGREAAEALLKNL